MSEYKPKRVGRPKSRKRGRRRKYKSPGPGSPLRKLQYKVLNLRPLTYAMVKELAAYYETSMMDFVHRMIEAAFNKTLAKVEAEDIKNRQEEEEYKARMAARRKEREDANKLNHPTPR